MMTIDKAIEILTAYCKGSDEAEPVDFDDTVKLGLEALKRIQRQRSVFLPGEIELLPGET